MSPDISLGLIEIDPSRVVIFPNYEDIENLLNLYTRAFGEVGFTILIFK